MNLRRIAQPVFEPVSVDEAKLHARVDNTDEDAYIAGLITSAREYVEDVLRRTLMGTEWEYVLDAWPVGGLLRIPRAPLRSVSSVKYVDDAGAETTFASGNYVVDSTGEPGRLSLKSTGSWPSATLQAISGVRVRFVAGYSDVLASNAQTEAINAARAAVPASAKHAIKLLVGHFYENREEMVAGAIPTRLQFGIDALLQPLRVLEF